MLRRCRRRHVGRAAEVMDGGAAWPGQEAKAEAVTSIGDCHVFLGAFTSAAPFVSRECLQHWVFHRWDVARSASRFARRAARGAAASARSADHAPLSRTR